MSRTTHGPVRAALEDTLGSTPRLKEKRHAALVSLCRVTADQVDQAGAEVSSRLIASYLSALKDLDRAIGTSSAPAASRTSSKKREEGTGGDSDDASALGALRGIKGGKAS